MKEFKFFSLLIKALDFRLAWIEKVDLGISLGADWQECIIFIKRHFVRIFFDIQSHLNKSEWKMKSTAFQTMRATDLEIETSHSNLTWTTITNLSDS